MSLGGSSVAVVQLPGGQFQVQGVIQSAQSSVIQSPQVQTAQVSHQDFFLATFLTVAFVEIIFLSLIRVWLVLGLGADVI